MLRSSLSQEINKYNERMMGYLASLSYNYCQLCVKADPTAMLPINIEIDGEIKHLEDVAGIVVHTKEKNDDDITIDVFTKETRFLALVTKAIVTYHPEFKTTMERFENDETRALDEMLEKERKVHPESFDEDADEMLEMSRMYIRCVMPHVDKDRRKTLRELVKLYYDKCMADFDSLKARTLVTLTPLFVDVPHDEVDKAKKELEDGADYYKDMADKLTDEKCQQIEEAYQEYIKLTGSDEQQDTAEVDTPSEADDYTSYKVDDNESYNNADNDYTSYNDDDTATEQPLDDNYSDQSFSLKL